MGPKLEIDLEGFKITARLLVDAAPKTTAALRQALPASGMARHAKWSGPAFYLLMKPGTMPDLPLENAHHLLRPGSVVYVALNCEILMVYGDARLCDAPAVDLYGTVVGEIETDLAEVKQKVFQMRLEGEKPITIRVA